MIVCAFLQEHEYLIDKPQTFNFGGEYLYSFRPSGKNLRVSREFNNKHIPGFFDITSSSCRINLLSAIVGENGAGKSSIMDSIRGIFVEHVYSMPHSLLTVLVEIDGNTKILSSNFDRVYLEIDDSRYEQLDKMEKSNYQSIYYSPHFDLKYNVDFDEVDQYDISLDQFVKQDLADTENKGTSENGWKFSLEEELVLKNSMRQIEFLNSSVFKENQIFQQVFDLPQYHSGVLHFRDVKIQKEWNTPNNLRPILNLIFEKIEKENSEWHIFRDNNSHLEKDRRQALVNRFLLERFVLTAFLSIILEQMEKSNTWLGEGTIEDPYNMHKFEKFSAKELFLYFIEHSYIKLKDTRREIFNKEYIFDFLKELEIIFSKEVNPDFIKKQSIRINLADSQNILVKHREIVTNLIHYFPATEGLVKKENFTDGFLFFRPTDRNFSSGENAFLNFFSKLHAFIENNLREERKTLPAKEFYVLLLDEADLGFHPVWKKKYIDAILKTLPFFFESLQVKPNLQIIITTHEPLTLSDLPINNIVLLKKDNGYSAVISNNDHNHIQKTFGANITDLLAHSFFIDDGLIGDFSKSKIQEVVRWLDTSKKLSDNQKSSGNFKEQVDYYKKVVSLIDEAIIKIKLSEMITDLSPDKAYYNEIIDQEIILLKSKKK